MSINGPKVYLPQRWINGGMNATGNRPHVRVLKQGDFREALIFSTCTGSSWADLSVDDVIDVSVVWIGR